MKLILIMISCAFKKKEKNFGVICMIRQVIEFC